MCISLIAVGNGIFALHLGWMMIDWVRLRVRGNKLGAELLNEPYTPHLGELPKAPHPTDEVVA
jgi:hypothetical protein